MIAFLVPGTVTILRNLCLILPMINKLGFLEILRSTTQKPVKSASG
ncbi:MAG: hypothetical protein HW406_2821 [Candidatus Brocadiaceae bacterium]|nr:hypothetical protein [Candidatus Brocadiaceae bacterium]